MAALGAFAIIVILLVLMSIHPAFAIIPFLLIMFAIHPLLGIVFLVVISIMFAVQ